MGRFCHLVIRTTFSIAGIGSRTVRPDGHFPAVMPQKCLMPVGVVVDSILRSTVRKKIKTLRQRKNCSTYNRSAPMLSDGSNVLPAPDRKRNSETVRCPE